MEKANKNGNSKSVPAVPEGLQTVTPYLYVINAEMLIKFMKEAFHGEVTFIMKDDKGKVTHATVRIGTSSIMVSDVMDNNPVETAMLYLYVEDADAVYKQALKAKAASVREPVTEFYGDRAAAVKDAWGNTWWIATHVEDVGPGELKKRAEQAYRKKQKQPEKAHA